MNALKNIKWIVIVSMIALLASCSNNGDRADAYGNFESNEVTISAEANGKLVSFDVKDGAVFAAGQDVGLIDTSQLYIQKRRLEASISTVRSKTMDVGSEVAVYREQKRNIEREYTRVQNLLKSEAATQKQVDDLKGQLDLVNRQLVAAETRLNNANSGILGEIEPIRWQIKQMEDQILKSRVLNPIDGTVIASYARKNEVVGFGIPLYKIANLTDIYLRAYIGETQLASVKIGSSVKVIIDDASGEKEYAGTITWISDVAEFTPKVIQTKEERVNLVYAMKVSVTNDGSIKLGMPGEVWLNTSTD